MLCALDDPKPSPTRRAIAFALQRRLHPTAHCPVARSSRAPPRRREAVVSVGSKGIPQGSAPSPRHARHTGPRSRAASSLGRTVLPKHQDQRLRFPAISIQHTRGSAPVDASPSSVQRSHGPKTPSAGHDSPWQPRSARPVLFPETTSSWLAKGRQGDPRGATTLHCQPPGLCRSGELAPRERGRGGRASPRVT